MHATVRRNEAVVGNWTDGLSLETRQAAVRGLLDFEGFRSPNRWTDPTALLREIHRRSSIQSARRDLAARTGKR